MAITAKIQARLNNGLRKYKRVLERAKAQGLNEADTSGIVKDILEDVLGYDRFDVTAEYRIRGQFADYALKIKDKLSIIVEVKSIALKITETHLTQATTYAAQHGIEWAILTNGANWQLYKLSFGKGIDMFLVFDLDIVSKELKPKQKTNLLYAISKEGFIKGETINLWKEKLALSTDNISKVVLSDTVIDKIRRELSAATGFRVAPEDLKNILSEKFKNR